MNSLLKSTLLLLLVFTALVLSCGKKEADTPAPQPTVNPIQSTPTVPGINGATVVPDAAGTSFTVTVPAGTNVKSLTLSIPLATGASIDPNPGTARDYTNPVIFIVTPAGGGTPLKITVTVVVQAAPKSSDKQITTFSFAALNPAVTAAIDQSTRKITATVPADADLTKLVPTLTLSAKATVAPASGLVQNFSNAVNYTVTAEDGSAQVYEVNITKVTTSITNSDVLYLAANDILYALDASTGSNLWSSRFSEITSGLAIENSVIYFGDELGRLLAVDAKTGKEKWKLQLTTDNSDVQSTPTIANGVIFLGSDENYIYAVDAATRTLKWKFKNELNSSGRYKISGGPVIADNTIFAGNEGGVLSALDATTGVPKWSKYFKGNKFNNNPVVVGKNLFVGDLFILNCETGEPIPNSVIPNGLVVAERNSPIVLNNTIFRCVKITGTSNDRYSVGANFLPIGSGGWGFSTTFLDKNTPYYYSNTLYFTSDEGTFALNATDGIVKWSLKYQQNYKKSIHPVIVNGVVYTLGESKSLSTSASERIYALDAASGTKKWEIVLPNSLIYDFRPVIVTKDGKAHHPTESGLQN